MCVCDQQYPDRTFLLAIIVSLCNNYQREVIKLTVGQLWKPATEIYDVPAHAYSDKYNDTGPH